MSAYGKPTEIEIASLKKHEVSYDVMRPGSGTPWEDRGASGVIGAFFKTCGRSLFKFPSLVDHIRRPETTGDAAAFAMVCAAMWAVSIGVWDGYQYFVASNFEGPPDKTPIIEGSQYLVESGLRILGAFAATWIVLKLSTKLFHALLTSDSQRQIPTVLVYNVFAYSLGPSLVALVPVFGWGIAALWIIINAFVGAKTRLYLRTREALVNIIIATVVSISILAAAYVACNFISLAVYGQHAIHPPEPVAKPPMMH